MHGAMRERGFTLIEILVTIAVIAALAAILLPALAHTRRHAWATLCTSNVRQQGAIVLTYTNDFAEALPPKLQWWKRRTIDGDYHNAPWLINRFLALYAGLEFPDPQFGFPHPVGGWRCPGVREDEDIDLRLTHDGFLHHAPNRWMFTSSVVNEQNGKVSFESDALPAWAARWGGRQWRRLGQVFRPGEVVMLMDNVKYFYAGHGHEEARAFHDESRAVVSEDDPCTHRNRGSHDALRLRPAVYADGHAAPVSSRNAF